MLRGVLVVLGAALAAATGVPHERDLANLERSVKQLREQQHQLSPAELNRLKILEQRTEALRSTRDEYDQQEGENTGSLERDSTAQGLNERYKQLRAKVASSKELANDPAIKKALRDVEVKMGKQQSLERAKGRKAGRRSRASKASYSTPSFSPSKAPSKATLSPRKSSYSSSSSYSPSKSSSKRTSWSAPTLPSRASEARAAQKLEGVRAAARRLKGRLGRSRKSGPGALVPELERDPEEARVSTVLSRLDNVLDQVAARPAAERAAPKMLDFLDRIGAHVGDLDRHLGASTDASLERMKSSSARLSRSTRSLSKAFKAPSKSLNSLRKYDMTMASPSKYASAKFSPKKYSSPRVKSAPSRTKRARRSLERDVSTDSDSDGSDSDDGDASEMKESGVDGATAGLERLSRHLHELRVQADKDPAMRKDPRVVKIVKKVQEEQAKFSDAEHDMDEEDE